MSNAEINHAIREGIEAIESNVFGALPLPIRRRIWRLFGAPRLQPDGRASGAGWERRLRLAIAAVSFVAPIWRQAFPGRDGPETMIALAGQVLSGRTGKEALETSERFQVYAENLGYDTDQEIPALVALAATKLVTQALYDQYLGEVDDELDDDLDPYQWDAAFVAAIAAANGPYGDPRCDNESRRKFWRWYVTIAVPEAYQSVAE